MRANAGSCGAGFRDFGGQDGGSPSRIQALRNVYEGRADAPEIEAAGGGEAVFSPCFPVCARYPQENTIFGDKVWVIAYILCISVFRVLTDGGKAYYI